MPEGKTVGDSFEAIIVRCGCLVLLLCGCSPLTEVRQFHKAGWGDHRAVEPGDGDGHSVVTGVEFNYEDGLRWDIGYVYYDYPDWGGGEQHGVTAGVSYPIWRRQCVGPR